MCLFYFDHGVYRMHRKCIEKLFVFAYVLIYTSALQTSRLLIVCYQRSTRGEVYQLVKRMSVVI